MQTSHVCLTAEGASQFARAMGIPEVPEESLITDYARKRWKDNLGPEANPVECQMLESGFCMLKIYENVITVTVVNNRQ